MDYRGPILIVFGLSLVMSPIAVRLVETGGATEPTEVVTRGQLAAACDANSIEGASLRVGCVNDLETLESRRFAAGGALFLSAGG